MSDRPTSRPNPGWTLNSTQLSFECPWFRVRKDDVLLPSGDAIVYNVVEHDGWAMVVPVLEDGRILMERVYRWTLNEWVLECPSGGLDGDPPEVAARRELEEETGYAAGELEHLGNFAASDGYTNERYDIYLGRCVRPGGIMKREATEEIELEFASVTELKQLALAGKITDGPSALAILLAAARLEGGER